MYVFIRSCIALTRGVVKIIQTDPDSFFSLGLGHFLAPLRRTHVLLFSFPADPTVRHVAPHSNPIRPPRLYARNDEVVPDI